jgi:hypothetical protein
MNKSKLMAVLLATVLVVSFSMATGEKAEPVGKSREMKITPLTGPFLEIDASGAPAAVKDPADLCVDQWQGQPAIIIEHWFTGDETYAVYQNPTETGCENTYPFGITDIIWHFYVEVACTLDVQPVVYEDVGTPTCPAPGPILCAGPIYDSIPLTPGGKILTMSLGDTCCVDGPYFAGIICTTYLGPDTVNIVTDDGDDVPPQNCRTYNDWGLGWKDLVADEGAPGNLSLWSQGYNTHQNMCGKLAIPPGVDLFETPNDSMTVESLFTVSPIPAGFFGPGSDPFDGTIALEGSPLTTSPPDTLGPTDVIIERLDTAMLNVTPSVATVAIELVALSLISTSPITVTYDGGQNPEEWQVDICLSSIGYPPSGFMYINRHCDSGGSFTVDFSDPIFLKATFTRVSPPAGPILVYDPYRTGSRSIDGGRWSTYVPPPFSVYTVPDWVEVDTDCDGSPDYSIPPDSGNFYPGIALEPCPPDHICGGKALTLLDGYLIDHRMLPPQKTSPLVGACCLPDSSCILVDSDCCGDLGGEYQGDYTNCFPDPCLACCNSDGIRGDVDYSGGSPNVGDLAYLVSYLFDDPPGPAPPCFEEGDVDGSGSINVGDLAYLVSYLFDDPPGPAPKPCP